MAEIITECAVEPLDITKALELPFKIAEGMQDIGKLSRYFEFDKKSTYYREAAETLGLVKIKSNKYYLTNLGKFYVNHQAPQRNELICRLLFELPTVNKILVELLFKPSKSLSTNEIAEIIGTHLHLSGATLTRRTETILFGFGGSKRV